MDNIGLLLILALAFGAMWLMTRRTRKQQAEASKFRANLAPGQEVMTGSGLFGTIVEAEGEIVTIETSPGVTSRWLRPAIAKLVDPPVPAEDDELDEDEEYDDEYEDDADLDGEDELDDEELDGEDELDDDELDADDELDDDLQVPDDASSLTAEPGEDDKPRR